MSEEGKAVMEEVEKEQSYEELAVLRRLVMTHIKTERELAEVNNNNNKQHQQNTTITAKNFNTNGQCIIIIMYNQWDEMCFETIPCRLRSGGLRGRVVTNGNRV